MTGVSPVFADCMFHESTGDKDPDASVSHALRLSDEVSFEPRDEGKGVALESFECLWKWCSLDVLDPCGWFKLLVVNRIVGVNC